MSLNRFNPRRDDNEPAIRKRFATNGWHTEQLSGAGMPDLLCWPQRPRSALQSPWGCLAASALVDVKMPGKGVTTAQVKKWTTLSAKGIPVYVASTEADVDAIVGGTATPWDNGRTEAVAKMKRSAARPGDRGLRVHATSFYPPRSPPMDASSLAAETFAPDAVPPCGHCGEEYDPKCYHRDAPPGSVSCRKDVHCIKHDGHKKDCQAINPRACTT